MNLPRVHISTFSFDLDARDVSSEYTFVETYITYSSIMLALPSRFINRGNMVACVLTKHRDARHNVKCRVEKTSQNIRRAENSRVKETLIISRRNVAEYRNRSDFISENIA